MKGLKKFVLFGFLTVVLAGGAYFGPKFTADGSNTMNKLFKGAEEPQGRTPSSTDEMKVVLKKTEPASATKFGAKHKEKVVAHGEDIVHTVGKDETAWFLAHVFYGKGEQYTKLLAANKMSSPEELKAGREILVPAPKYSPKHADFSARYTDLWEKREKALAEKRLTTSHPQKEVVVADTTVKNSHHTPAKLPFMEVKDPTKSPVDKAKEELQKLSEQETFKRTSGDKEPF